jgi:hypothetical protein
MEPEKALRPVPPSPNSALKLKFVGLKEDLLVRAHVPGNFLAIEGRENRVADANGLSSLNWIPREMPKKAVPITMIHTN